MKKLLRLFLAGATTGIVFVVISEVVIDGVPADCARKGAGVCRLKGAVVCHLKGEGVCRLKGAGVCRLKGAVVCHLKGEGV